MENSKEEDRFFICRIRKTLQKYNLPSPEEILENPPKKQQYTFDFSHFVICYVVFLLDFVEFLDILM
jgi:hypothetical protein